MVNTNKILTVSYGTFSCTLEGFEDSFGTMKAIAEYFRDLASDDRYFGAEPPTPDAEMLARIAEREIARRVQANISDGNITLRADSNSILPVAAPVATAAAAATPEAATPEAAPKEDAPESAAPATEPTAERAAEAPAETAQVAPEAANASAPQVAAEHAAPKAETVAETVAEPVAAPVAEAPAIDPNSVAAKLQRIRAVVAQSEDSPYSEDEHAEAYAEEFIADTHEEIEAALEADDQAEEARATDSADNAQDTAEDDISALLDRYGVEGHHAFDRAEADTASDDRPEDMTSEKIVEDVAEDAFEEDMAEADMAEEASEETLAEETLAEETLAEETLAEDLPEEDTLEDDADDIALEQAVEQAKTPTQPLRARVIKMKRVDFEAAIAAGDLEEEIDNDDEDTTADSASDSSLSPDEEADLMRELAAVEAELAGEGKDQIEEPAIDLSALDLGSLDVTAEDDSETETATKLAQDDADGDDEPLFDAAAQAEDSISAMLGALDLGSDALDEAEEDEAEDMAFDDADDDDTYEDEAEDFGHDSLLSAEADDEDDYEDDTAESLFADDDDDDRDESDSQAARSRFSSDADAELGRIFEATDEQMAEETGKGRRNAIAHLRAAVMAAKAEERTGGRLNVDGPDSEAYRDDLASVVRPRRPEAGKAHTRRPEVNKPAPLKLVAEQRVDLDAAENAAPVRPRRIARAQAALEEQVSGGNFAEYADSVGAVSLPELLEAAAAYLSFVEGRAQFSRPQLMTQVRQVEKDDFSREDGLRSFGKLLRDGKIQKLEGGRFKASESISYRPDARYAGE